VAFPYESFYWANIDLETRFGAHKFKVSVHPNMAKVIDVTTSQTVNIFVGEDRKALAVADAIGRMEYWDRHVSCCWKEKKLEAQAAVRKRKRTRTRSNT
jgi:hypothetical protein